MPVGDSNGRYGVALVNTNSSLDMVSPDTLGLDRALKPAVVMRVDCMTGG